MFALKKLLLLAVKWIDSFLLLVFERWHFNVWGWCFWISASPSSHTPTHLTSFTANFSFNSYAFLDSVLLKYTLHFCFAYYPVNFSSVSSLSLLDPLCISNATLTVRLRVSWPSFHFYTASIIALKIELQASDFFARIDPSLFLRSHQIKEYLWQITMRKITTVRNLLLYAVLAVCNLDGSSVTCLSPSG